MHMTKEIQGAPFQCEISNSRVEVWGPCNLLLRAHTDGTVYCNLKPEVEGPDGEARPVFIYHEMLYFALRGAMKAAQNDIRIAYKNPVLIGTRFLDLLALNRVDLKEVARRNAEEKDPNVCHSHDFCDANMLMLEAAEDLGVMGAPDTEEKTKLWDESWEYAKRALQLLQNKPFQR